MKLLQVNPPEVGKPSGSYKRKVPMQKDFFFLSQIALPLSAVLGI
jgi:hypothetical protein